MEIFNSAFARGSTPRASFPNPSGRGGAFLLHLVRRYDRDLRWWFIVANDRPEVLEQLLFHQHMQNKELDRQEGTG